MATTPTSITATPQASAANPEVAAAAATEAVVLQATPEKKPVDTSIAAVAAAAPIPVSGNAPLTTKDEILAKARKEAEAAEAAAAQKKGAELKAINDKSIDEVLATTTDPDAIATLKEARISGSPMILVAAKIAAAEAAKAATAEPGVVGVGTGPVAPGADVLAAIAADKAQLPVATGTAGVVAELATVGAGDAIASLRPDQPLDPTIRQVGPGAAALTTVKADQIASDDKVKVTFPNKVVLTRKDYSRVEFPAGQSEIPAEYLDHPYLIASGMKVVPAVGQQIPVVVQAGTVAPVAPVK